jgi:hypothetical protein
MTSGKKRPNALHRRAEKLLHQVVALSREVEKQYGRDDDRTIFAKNANCELLELERMLAVGELTGGSKKDG